MGQPTIDFDAEYRFFDGKTQLNAKELTRRFLSLHQRLVAMEMITYTFESLATEIGNLGLTRINSIITPLIEAAGVQLDTITEAVAEAQALLAQLQASGLDAANIDLAPIEGITATDVQAALAEVLTIVTESSAAATAAANRISAKTYFVGGF